MDNGYKLIKNGYKDEDDVHTPLHGCCTNIKPDISVLESNTINNLNLQSALHNIHHDILSAYTLCTPSCTKC